MTPEERQIDLAASAFRIVYNEQVAKGQPAAACLEAMRRVIAEKAGRDHDAIRAREAARHSALDELARLGQEADKRC